MNLRQTPSGTWAGSQKDWEAAMKAEGHDIKAWKDRCFVDVPVSKAELMEFLTFHDVNVICPQPLSVPTDPDMDGVILPAVADSSAPTTVPDLDALFTAAPIFQQMRLAVEAIDAATAILQKS